MTRTVVSLAALIGFILFILFAAVTNFRDDNGFDTRVHGLSAKVYSGDSNSVKVLQNLGDDVVPDLIILLETKDPIGRRVAWALLRQMPRSWRTPMMAHIKPPTAVLTREAAARSLATLGENAQSACDALAVALRDPEGRVRLEAAAALAKIGRDAVPVLIKALEDRDPKVRFSAAVAIGEIGPTADLAVSHLTTALRDKTDYVRKAAAHSLARLGLPGLSSLVAAAQSNQSLFAKAAAQDVLSMPHLNVQYVTPQLIQLFNDEDPQLRKRCIEITSAITAAQGITVDFAYKALQDSSADVRLAAVTVIGKMGPKMMDLAPYLTNCLRDQDVAIREKTAWALEEITKSEAF